MKNLLLSVVNTHPCWAALIARLTLAIVMFPHGAQKLLGWFGGYGWRRTIEFFTHTFHMSPTLVWLLIAAEFLGSIALVLGLLSRVAALGFIASMAGAITMVHAYHGFFMNWSGQQKGEGFEFHILALGLALVVLITGGG
jgi:putative oxidoreductase